MRQQSWRLEKPEQPFHSDFFLNMRVHTLLIVRRWFSYTASVSERADQRRDTDAHDEYRRRYSVQQRPHASFGA